MRQADDEDLEAYAEYCKQRFEQGGLLVIVTAGDRQREAEAVLAH
jgi:hypothetical protein